MPDEKSKKEFTLVYRFGRTVSRILFRMLCPTRVTGRETIKKMQAPYLIIANHQHFLDPMLLGALCPYEVRFMGKQELAGSRFAKWLFRQLHMITVARHETDLEAMRKITKELRAGHVVGIFPEGTRHLPEMMSTVESGASFLALREKLPMVPVYIHKKFRLFHGNTARVGAPITPDTYPEGGANKENAGILNERIRDLFYDLRRQEEEKA